MIWDGTEKRRLIRTNLPCRVIIYAPKKETIDTIINNICEGGVGFTLRRELEVSSIVGLEIYQVKEKPIVCKGIIRWVKAMESSRLRGHFFYNTGVEFYQIKYKDRLAIRNLVTLRNTPPQAEH